MRIFWGILKSLRIYQWAKNLLLFAPLVFSEHLFHISYLLRSILAFFLFCLLSGSVYLLNDIIDMEKDRLHPVKSKRPVASGQVPVSIAFLAFSLIAFPVLLAGFLYPFFTLQGNLLFGFTLTGYFLLNTAYSFILKHIVIIDVMTISFGFILRITAGGIILNVEISNWILICTFFLAIFLGFGKRRHELTLTEGERHRPILKEYSAYFLDQMMSVVTTSTVVAYLLYTLDPRVMARLDLDEPYLLLTLPFVLYGIFRYLYLVHQREEGGDPTKALLTDPYLLLDVFLWFLSATLILYI